MGTAWLHSLLAMHLYWKSYILQSHEQTWNTFTACMPDLLGNFGKELINSWFVCPTGGKLIYTCRKVVWAPMRNSIRKSSTYPNLSTRVHNTLYLIWLPWRLHGGSELCIQLMTSSFQYMAYNLTFFMPLTSYPIRMRQTPIGMLLLLKHHC